MWRILVFLSVIHCAASLSKSCTNCDSNRIIRVKYLNAPNSTIFGVSVVWDDPTSSALWIDYGVRSSKPCLFRYDSIKHKTYSAYLKNKDLPPPGFIVPAETSSDSLSQVIVGFGRYVYLVDWDGKSESASINRRIHLGSEGDLGPYERQGPGHRDPSGRRLYTCTLDTRLCGPPANQSIYVKQNGRESIRLISKLKTVLGFAYVGKKVYAIDSCANKIIDVNSGHVVFDFKCIGKVPGDFIPLGLEAGSDGILYTCGYYDGYLYAVDLKSKSAKRVVELGEGINSVSFGGRNSKGGDDLYVTSATVRLDYSNGSVIRRLNPSSTLYQVSGAGAGVIFKRSTVRK